MAAQDTCCTIVTYYTVTGGNLPEFKDVRETLIEKMRTEDKCLNYGFSFDRDRAYCREGYADADGLLTHLEKNVGPLLHEALQLAETRDLK